MPVLSLPHCTGGLRPRASGGMVLLSVALTLGLTAAVTVALQMVQRGQEENRRVRATLEHMERIRKAVCAFDKLVSAGLPTQAPTPSPARPNPPELIEADPNSTGNLVQLGLSFADTIDGWGRLISVFHKFPCNSTANLQVDIDGDGSADVANACLVLVSHGKTGYGAFLPSGSGAWMQPLPTDSGINTGGSRAEWRNTQSNSGTSSQPLAAAPPQLACSSPLPRTDPASPCHFDDIVRYYTATALCS